MRKLSRLIATVCLCFSFSSHGSPPKTLSESILQGLEKDPYPWAISEPQLLVRLDSDLGYHARDSLGVIRGRTWVFEQIKYYELGLQDALSLKDIYYTKGTRGKAVLVYLDGPYTFAYFVSRHLSHPTLVGIEVPGKVNLETLNEIASASFPEIWKTLDPIEVVKTYDMIPVKAHKDIALECQSALASCSIDDLVCELERRGWKVNLSSK